MTQPLPPLSSLSSSVVERITHALAQEDEAVVEAVVEVAAEDVAAVERRIPSMAPPRP